jgi:uncharacterized membrane protein
MSELEQKKIIDDHVKIAQQLESALLDKDAEVEELKAQAEAAAKIKTADTRAILIIIALIAPILFMAFLVLYNKTETTVSAATSFVSFLTGGITVPLIMHYFGIDKDIQSQVIDSQNKN